MAYKINPDLLVGATGHSLQWINDRLGNVSSKMDYDGIKGIQQVPMCYQTLGQNPDLNKICRAGIYPLYSYNASMQDGSTKFITWGSCIVIPYTYGSNNDAGQNWYIQLIICANSWDETPSLSILGRTCSYYGGWGKWRILA